MSTPADSDLFRATDAYMDDAVWARTPGEPVWLLSRGSLADDGPLGDRLWDLICKHVPSVES